MADTQDKQELAEHRTEAAERRTAFAEDRTVQANERTFAGWMRTAFAAIGVGLAFHVIFGDLEPPWLARAISTLFILIGAAIAFSAERRALKTFKRLQTHEIDRPNMGGIRWLSWAVIIGAATLIAGLWILNDGSVGDGR